MKTKYRLHPSINALKAGLPAALFAITLTTSWAATLYDKGQSWGNSDIGASYRVFAEDITGTNSYTLRGYARADARALGVSANVARADGRAISYKAGTGRLMADVRVFGLSVWDYDKSGSTSWSESLSWIKQKTLASARFWVGPIPMKLTAGASVSARADASVKIEALDPTAAVFTPIVRGNITPKFDAALTGSISVDVYVASAGVRARLTLAKVELPCKATLAPKIETQTVLTSPILTASFSTFTFSTTTTTSTFTSALPTLSASESGRTFVATWDVDLNLSSLNGYVQLYAKYFNPSPWSWGWKTAYKNIISWNGFTQHYDLANGSKEITLGGGGLVATQ